MDFDTEAFKFPKVGSHCNRKRCLSNWTACPCLCKGCIAMRGAVRLGGIEFADKVAMMLGNVTFAYRFPGGAAPKNVLRSARTGKFLVTLNNGQGFEITVTPYDPTQAWARYCSERHAPSEPSEIK